MTRIVSTKTGTVTLGVLDKNLEIQPHLQQVTFEDRPDTLRTVHAHIDGPFSTPEDIVQAAVDGTLHPFETHEQAAAFERDRGNHDAADTFQALADEGSSAGQPRSGGE